MSELNGRLRDKICETHTDVKWIKEEMKEQGKILLDHGVRLNKAELDIALIKDRGNFFQRWFKAALSWLLKI